MELNFYENKKVLVTGGASFIGSHLVDKLVSLKSNVTVVDDLSSGRLENLSNVIDKIKFVKEDLEYASLQRLKEIFKGNEIVFI
jgi:UDP-glucose 4-epimerase